MANENHIHLCNVSAMIFTHLKTVAKYSHFIIGSFYLIHLALEKFRTVCFTLPHESWEWWSTNSMFSLFRNIPISICSHMCVICSQTNAWRRNQSLWHLYKQNTHWTANKKYKNNTTDEHINKERADWETYVDISLVKMSLIGTLIARPLRDWPIAIQSSVILFFDCMSLNNVSWATNRGLDGHVASYPYKPSFSFLD